MIRSRMLCIICVMVMLVLAWIAQGCGGGGAGGVRPEAGKGAVTGRMVDITSGHGIGNMQVTIGGRTATSDADPNNSVADGTFTVMNITPGTYPIQVAETALFVLPPGPPMYVTVQADTTYTLAGPIYIIDPNYLPPGS